MSSSSYFNKVITFLAEVNKGKHEKLIEGGWISARDMQRITVILHKLDCIDKKGDKIIITKKGLNILLHQKTGKLGDSYNEDIVSLLISDTT